MTTVFYSNGSGIYNNGKVAVTKDFVFGLSVYTENGWVPMTSLEKDDVLEVRRLIDGDPLFMWWEPLNQLWLELIGNEGLPVFKTSNINTNTEKVKDVPSEVSGRSDSVLTDLEYYVVHKDRYDKDFKPCERRTTGGTIEYYNDKGWMFAKIVSFSNKKIKSIENSRGEIIFKGTLDECKGRLMRTFG